LSYIFSASIKPDSYRETAPARTPFPMDDDRSRSQKDAQRAYQEELKRQVRIIEYGNSKEIVS